VRSPARRGVGGARGPQAGERDGGKAEPTDEVAGGGAGPTELDGGGAGGWRLALTEWRRRRGVLEAWGRRQWRGRTGGWGRGGAGGALGGGSGGLGRWVKNKQIDLSGLISGSSGNSGTVAQYPNYP